MRRPAFVFACVLASSSSSSSSSAYAAGDCRSLAFFIGGFSGSDKSGVAIGSSPSGPSA
jgi:hypothetical protein